MRWWLAGGVEAAECFEHGRIGPGPGLDGIEEVAGVDEHAGFFAMVIFTGRLFMPTKNNYFA
jgi:hypothetical protein